MERAAKRLAALCLLAWGMFLPSCACAATWLTDLPAAQASAKAEEKVVLLNFTGSDWCGWCIRLRNEVFSQPEFDAYANDHLLLVEADFPHRKEQSAALKQSNAALSRQFHIRGYPTLIVLSADGQQLGTLGYQPGGPQAFIAELSRISGHKAAAAPPAASAKPPKANDPPPLPPFNGAPTFPPQKFHDLVLKGISGPKNNRLAVINNQTLGVGESAVLKVSDGQLKVKCLEIHDDTVVVSVDGGARRELRMRGGL